MEYKQKKARQDVYGNVLNKGESYKAGKELYTYRYRDIVGIDREVSAKTLEMLREKERKIEKDLQDGINTAAGRGLTLNKAFDGWMERNRGKKDQDTLDNYKCVYDNNVRQTKLGRMNIVNIKKAYIETHFNNLSATGKAKHSLKLLKAILNQVFEDAADNDIIRRNPVRNATYDGKVKEVTGLTERQQEILFTFMEDSTEYQFYVPLLTFAIETGLREGELTGLLWDNIDLENDTFTVDHQLKYKKRDGSYRLLIKQCTKTKADRIVILSAKAKQALIEQQLLEQRMRALTQDDRGSITIDGVTGFIWLKKNGNLYAPNAINFVLKNIVTAYNRQELQLAEYEERNPELLPHIHCHMLRHTFSSNRNRNGGNPIVTRDMMGHKRIEQTEDYTHSSVEDMKKDVRRLDTIVLKIG